MKRWYPLLMIVFGGMAGSFLAAVWAHDSTCARGACVALRFGPGITLVVGALLAFLAGYCFARA